MDDEFGVFLQNGEGPVWVESLNDLAEAKQKAQEVADKDEIECFVYSFDTFREEYRAYPHS